MAPEAFASDVQPLVEADLGRGLEPAEAEVLASMAPLVQERTKLLAEVAPQVRFLFGEPERDEASWSKVMKPEAAVALTEGAAVLGELEEWTTVAIEVALRGMLEAAELTARKGLQPIRVAVTGSSISPPLFESLEALGRERSLARLEEAIHSLG
jgi:glutamyl-tRNA synthetase